MSEQEIIIRKSAELKLMVGLALSLKECETFIKDVIEAQNKVKNLNIDDVSRAFYCETKRGCLEQCNNCSLTELAKDMAC